MEYGPFAGDSPDISDADHGFDTCDGTDHECGASVGKGWPCSTGTPYGILTNYVTGEAIRPASWGEWARSMESGPVGVYRDPVHGPVFVSGGPTEPGEALSQLTAE